MQRIFKICLLLLLVSAPRLYAQQGTLTTDVYRPDQEPRWYVRAGLNNGYNDDVRVSKNPSYKARVNRSLGFAIGGGKDFNQNLRFDFGYYYLGKVTVKGDQNATFYDDRSYTFTKKGEYSKTNQVFSASVDPKVRWVNFELFAKLGVAVRTVTRSQQAVVSSTSPDKKLESHSLQLDLSPGYGASYYFNDYAVYLEIFPSKDFFAYSSTSLGLRYNLP